MSVFVIRQEIYILIIILSKINLAPGARVIFRPCYRGPVHGIASLIDVGPTQSSLQKDKS
jgi:hypothetical protein